jgi:hypothetical protein
MRFWRCRVDFVETSVFGGFTAKGGLLCDPGELVLEEVAGGVGPFARPVWLAAADAEAFGRGLVERLETGARRRLRTL